MLVTVHAVVITWDAGHLLLHTVCLSWAGFIAAILKTDNGCFYTNTHTPSILYSHSKKGLFILGQQWSERQSECREITHGESRAHSLTCKSPQCRTGNVWGYLLKVDKRLSSPFKQELPRKSLQPGRQHTCRRAEAEAVTVYYGEKLWLLAGTYTGHTCCSPPHRAHTRHNLDPRFPLRKTTVWRNDSRRCTGVRQWLSLLTPQHNRYKNFINNVITLFTFSTLQLHTHSICHVVGGVTLEAVSLAGAEAAVVRAQLTAPLPGVVEALGTGVHTATVMEVALHSKLIWGTSGRSGVEKREPNLWVNLTHNYVWFPTASSFLDLVPCWLSGFIHYVLSLKIESFTSCFWYWTMHKALNSPGCTHRLNNVYFSF